MKSGTYEGISSYIPQIDNPKNEIFGYQKPKDQTEIRRALDKGKSKITRRQRERHEGGSMKSKKQQRSCYVRYLEHL